MIQVSSGDGAEQMMKGEFASEEALRKYIPEMVAEPIAVDQYHSDPKTWFYLCEFKEMTEQIPRPSEFCASLARLHRKSMGSQTKYGFDELTTQRNIPLDNRGWNSSWCDFFANAMEKMIEQEAKTQGRSTEIDDLAPALIKKVIPRLLRPLEEHIKPCLVHGDLWHGNTSVSVESGEPCVFDSCALWAHNECVQLAKEILYPLTDKEQMTWQCGGQNVTSFLDHM